MPQIASEPMPVLPHQHHHAPGGSDREHVQQHRLQRQHQRAERAREQQERQGGDQRDDERELAVDGVDEVGTLRRLAADRDPAPVRCGCGRASRGRRRSCRPAPGMTATSPGRPATRRAACTPSTAAASGDASEPRTRPRTATAARRRCPTPRASRARRAPLPTARATPARGLPSWSEKAAAPSATSTAVDAIGGGPAVAHDEPRPRGPAAPRAIGPARRGQSSRGPIVASTTGSSVSATATLTSGISIPAIPMLRRNGTGRMTSASIAIATVVPLNTTAARRGPSRWSPPRRRSRRRSSRQRMTTSSA